MMKTKTLSLISIAAVLTAAVMVSYLMTRPALFVKESSIPIFMGEELIIQKAAEKTVTAVKVQSVPAPVPKVAAPLPILPPRVSYRVLPEYPVSALQQGLQGTAILSIYVGLSGAAERVELKSSSGVAELDRSAVAAVSEWKFNPAIRGGAAIASWFEVPVRFAIK
jgi:TonB family protein